MKRLLIFIIPLLLFSVIVNGSVFIDTGPSITYVLICDDATNCTDTFVPYTGGLKDLDLSGYDITADTFFGTVNITSLPWTKLTSYPTPAWSSDKTIATFGDSITLQDINITESQISDLSHTTDTDTHKTTNGFYLYNDSTIIYFNETQLNNTISIISGGSNNNYTTAINFEGTTTKTLNLTRNDGTIIQASFTDIDTDTFIGNCSGNNSCSNIIYFNNQTDINITESQISDLSHTTDTDTQKATNGFYLYNDSTIIYFNETQLNNTILLKDYYSSSVLNSTYILQSSEASLNVNSSQFLLGNITESQITDLLHTTDTDTQKGTTGFYLYNDSTIIYFNETQLNTTIDAKTATVTYLPSVLAVETGTVDSGNLTSIQFINDNDSLNVSEVSGATPILIYVNFTNVLDFNNIIVREWYVGGAGHEINVELWNYITSSWDTHIEITDMGGFSTTSATVLDATANHINNSLVQIKMEHEQNGIQSHDFFVDYVALQDGFSSIVTSEHDALSGRDSITNHPWAFSINGEQNMTGNLNLGGNNMTNIDAIFALDWSNVTIIESQVTDLVHTADTQKATAGFYLYNDSTIIYFNETQLNITIGALDTDTQLSNATVQSIISNQDVYLKNDGDTASGNYTFLDTVRFESTTVFNDPIASQFNVSFFITDGSGTIKVNISAVGDSDFNAGNVNILNNLTVDTPFALDWSNVTITESQVTDLVHTTDTQKATNGFYLYNDSTIIYFNETQLNNTINAIDTDTTYTAGEFYINLVGTEFSLDESAINTTMLNIFNAQRTITAAEIGTVGNISVSQPVDLDQIEIDTNINNGKKSFDTDQNAELNITGSPTFGNTTIDKKLTMFGNMCIFYNITGNSYVMAFNVSGVTC